jgi:hypothetical protein
MIKKGHEPRGVSIIGLMKSRPLNASGPDCTVGCYFKGRFMLSSLWP